MFGYADCPGTRNEQAGKADACQGCPNQAVCISSPKGPDPDEAEIASRLKNVKHVILVLSGKGGVGKSTVSAQLALALAARDLEVGLLDIDICGPSIPRMMGLEGEEIHQSNLGWSPVYVQENLGVMSIGFMLPNPDDAVIWRGPRKNGLIKQFLKDVHWGELDYLVIDAPPGTSDEHISIVQLLKSVNKQDAIIVTTPQEVSLMDVRKEINFCRKTQVPILGVVENMSGLTCSIKDLTFYDGNGSDITEVMRQMIGEKFDGQKLSAEAPVFWASSGGAMKMAQDMGVRFLGRIPLDRSLSKAAEEGSSILDSKVMTLGQRNGTNRCFSGESSGRGAADAFSLIVESVLES